MMRWTAGLVTWAALAAAPACAAQPGAEVRELASYPGALGKPIEEKVSLGHPALLAWQHKINRDYGQDIRPRAAAPDHPLIPAVRAAITSLPEPVRRLASRHVVALFLLEEDFGTGTTEAVRDKHGKWRYGYIALNLTALTRTANAWGSWKEGSAFRPAAGHAIRMVLERPADDTHEGAIRFILLHELGHVLGLALGAHGFWDAQELPAATTTSAFVRLSWEPEGDGTMGHRWRRRHPELTRLGFYRFAEAHHTIADAATVYRALSTTNLPSLYAATNLYDDFAESFAIYVHTRLMGKPYRVTVTVDGAPQAEFRSCVTTGACPEKVAALERLLRQ